MSQVTKVEEKEALRISAEVHEVKVKAVLEPDTDVTAQLEGVKAKTVHNAELFAAVKESPIPRWSKESKHLYYSVFVAFCCACANGYDGSLMTGIIDMEQFQNVFHSSDTGSQVAYIFSMYTVGHIFGAPVAAVVSDRLGRRRGMFWGGAVIILGAIVIATASTTAQFVAGRFILGFAIAIMASAAAAYAIEIAPPHWRGRCAGFYNCGWFGGSIPAALIVYGCHSIKSEYAFRIPLLLQSFACIIVMASVFFIPESPRWLMLQGRKEEAFAFLVKYHGNNNPNSHIVRLEMDEMEAGISQNGIDKTWWDYRPLFLEHSGRWRMAQVLMIALFGQFSGNGLGYFNTVIFKNLGVATVEARLGFNVLGGVISAIAALTAMSLTDKMNRRPVLVIGTFMCAFFLAINAGLSDYIAVHRDEIPVQKGALATYFFFNIAYCFTYTPLQGVIPTEALETSTRAKGLALATIISNLTGFINQFAGPIALHNIANNYMWVFVGWDIVESILWYFFCVESQGRTLEQLEWVYRQANPVKASKQVDKVVVQADGKVTEKIVSQVDQ